MVVGGYRYDSESNELQEIRNGIPVGEADSARTPPTPGMDSDGFGLDRSLKSLLKEVDRARRGGAVGSKFCDQMSSSTAGSEYLQLEGEVQLLHKTMDVSQEQIAELKWLIIMQQNEAEADRRGALTYEEVV